MSYFSPQYKATSFTCPICNVYSQMIWYQWQLSHVGTLMERARCEHCKESSYWLGSVHGEFQGSLLFPLISGVPLPHPDMPDNVQKDYLEAREVLPYSSRAAAALIRLAMQRLCIHLGKSKNINIAIGQLVKDGLPEGVQKSFDAIRIIGNESVHPGELQDEDIDKSVGSMFELLNFIVDDRISRFKKIDAIYESLPEEKKQGVQQRDSHNK